MDKLFKKKEIFKVKSRPIDPTSIEEPSTADEFQRRGMAYYARKNFEAAISDLKKAVLLDNTHIDAHYSLGMVLKAVGRNEEAVVAFKQALSLIESSPADDSTKFAMLKRLATGHVNEITQGDWNLEKEIWRHVD